LKREGLYNAGVPIIVGSDASGQARGTAYGLEVHIEIHLLIHKVGMAPIDALKGATSLTADRFGFHDRGRIGPGKKADLVLVEGDLEPF
jgi:imidazolonepropionase-like amidohydrolase